MPCFQLPDPQTTERMAGVRQHGTEPEAGLRRELYRGGLRDRVKLPVLETPRRVADVTLPGLKIVVFADGCFWHGRPMHVAWPKRNAVFWRQKIKANRLPDADTYTKLRERGWTLLRVWEFETPVAASRHVIELISGAQSRRGKSPAASRSKN